MPRTPGLGAPGLGHGVPPFMRSINRPSRATSKNSCGHAWPRFFMLSARLNPSGRGKMSGIRGWWVVSAVLAIIVLPGLAGPASAASYAWTVTCKGDAYGTASWDWLQDGQVITGAGGSARCYRESVSGGGDRPASANGFTARVCAEPWGWSVSPDTCGKTVTESFDPSGRYSVTLKASFSFSYENPECGWPEYGHRYCRGPIKVSGSATFTLSS